MKTLLAIDYTTNWIEKFKNAKLDNGEEIKVEQVEWKDLSVEMSAEDGAVVFCKQSEAPLPFTNQKEDRIVKPDFVLVRNFPISLRSKDYKSQVMGLMAANLGSVNSLNSIFMCMHRPLLYGELLRISKEIHASPDSTEEEKSIDIVPLRYCANATISSLGKSNLSKPSKNDKLHSGQFPTVVKVSNTHAGYGKMALKNDTEFDDLRCILALREDYYTSEPMIEFEYEFRIQKIGDNYRCFRRNSDTSWKGNWGNVKFVDHEMQPHYKKWADKCSEIFGGLDIFGIDVLQLKDGSCIILELNDTATGLMWEHEEEDCQHIKEVVLQRMNERFQ